MDNVRGDNKMNYILVDTLNIDNEDKEYLIRLGTKKELVEDRKWLNFIDKFIGKFKKGRYVIVREDKLYDIKEE